ncbi:MAG: cytochrome-c peroxidase [Gammaproteobacteria bacterium]|nr:cytochrome-c peroxidase [Gammaproteobacteria bacterium]
MKIEHLFKLTICVGLLGVGSSTQAKSLPSPITDADFHDNGKPSVAKVELGKNLMFDKILSGNKNISCATCHHSLTGTGDGLSLPIGEGAKGLGITRDTGSGINAVHERVPRNAPHVFNKGMKQFVQMFHDGRVSLDNTYPSGCKTPAGQNLLTGLENILACQAMFPVTSGTEMAGQAGENSVADAAANGNLSGPGGVWDQLAGRLRAIPEYVEMFKAAFDDVSSAEDITFAHAANAISAFERVAWRADNSPFDRYLRGEHHAMSKNAQKGMFLFYNNPDSTRVSCGDCHSGVLQTDHKFHAIAMPQIGAGRGDGYDGYEDYGREQVTGVIKDRYKFRTPSLRNIALTAPYGHSGAYNTLRAVVEHHMNTVKGISNYDQSQAVLPSRGDLDQHDFVLMNDASRVAEIAAYSELQPMNYNHYEIEKIIDFLYALTDRGSVDMRDDLPKRVPSGLTLAE